MRTAQRGAPVPLSYAVSGPDQDLTEEGGSPGRDLVLVHGWCCDRSCMEPLRQALSGRHRVVSLDLRGHGSSRDPDEDGSAGVGDHRICDPELSAGPVASTIADFSGDVLALCQAADLRGPVVIGHSMGGLVAVDTLARADSPLRRSAPASWQPAGAVLLDPAPIAREKGKEFWAQEAQEVRGDHTGEHRREFARSLLLPTDRVDYDELIEQMAATPPAVAAGGAQAMATFDGAGALAQLASPALVIHAASAERGLEQLVPDRRLLTLGRTVGAGHFHQLEVPEQVLAMIERWLEVTFAPIRN